MCWNGFPWEKWCCFRKQFFILFLLFYICLAVWKRCNINALVLRKLSQESCGLPEWFLSGIYFLNHMVFFAKGKIKHGSEYKKMDRMIHESHFSFWHCDFIFCGMAACEAFCSALRWFGCLCTHTPAVGRNRSGVQNPRGFVLLKKKTTRGTRAERVLYQVISTNVVHTWMIFSNPFEKLRWSAVIIVDL